VGGLPHARDGGWQVTRLDRDPGQQLPVVSRLLQDDDARLGVVEQQEEGHTPLSRPTPTRSPTATVS